MSTKKRPTKAELTRRFRDFLDACMCPIYIDSGDIRVVEFALPCSTPGVYVQLRRNGLVYVGQAVDILQRQRQHLADGQKLWALGIYPIDIIDVKTRSAHETMMIKRARLAGFELANVAKVKLSERVSDD